VNVKRKVKKHKSSFDFDATITKIAQSISLDLSAHPVVTGWDQSLMYGPQQPGNTLTQSVLYYNRVQQADMLKKYVSVSDKELEDVKQERAYSKFRAVNSHMGHYSGKYNFPDPSLRVQRSVPRRSRILLRARAIVHSMLTPFTEDEYFLHCRNSHGTSIGVPYVDTSDEKKFKYPISCTAGVVSLFDRYLNWDANLDAAIKKLNCCAPTSVGRYDIVKGSRATTVAKNDEIRRMIALEGTINMFFQQGLMSLMYERMRSVGLDVDCLPDQHQELARLASISGSDATIDWSSASDCNHRELVEFLFPLKWFMAIDQVRSPYMEIEGEFVELNMISTMGNATTFPIETIVFWALGHAVLLEDGTPYTNSCYPEWGNLRRVSVFGDDCIVPTFIAKSFIATCVDVGFIINEEKSFYDEGSGFRESCGGDFLHGCNVRPFHLKCPSGTRDSDIEPWLYIQLNKVIKRYILYFDDLSYAEDKLVFRYCFSLFRELGIAVKVVPEFFPDDAGLKIGHDLSTFRTNYQFDMSPLWVDQNGTIKFNFLNYRLWEKGRKYDDLRLALWLRTPSQSEVSIKAKRTITAARQQSRAEMLYRTRRKGSYVVGASISSFWKVLF